MDGKGINHTKNETEYAPVQDLLSMSTLIPEIPNIINEENFCQYIYSKEYL